MTELLTCRYDVEFDYLLITFDKEFVYTFNPLSYIPYWKSSDFGYKTALQNRAIKL